MRILLIGSIGVGRGCFDPLRTEPDTVDIEKAGIKVPPLFLTSESMSRSALPDTDLTTTT
jgi:hypothetical protein